jgi:Trypsin-like peptidase domain
LVALAAAAKACARESTACVILALAVVAPNLGAAAERPSWLLHLVNIIDGADRRDSLLAIGPRLGLSPDEMARIRKVSGYVGCLAPSPSVGSGALFLSNRQILTAAHIFFEDSGRKRWKCFFKNQDSAPVKVDLLLDDANARFGALPPKSGSNDDYAIVRLAEPIGGEPFPVAPDTPPRAGDPLIVVSSHPAGMAIAVDNGIPVVQSCKIRRVPKPTAATSFYRTDCDASGESSGSMNLARVDGRLVFRGIVITTGPWRDPKLVGAPYDEAKGSVTTALGTDAAILKAGRELTGP